MFLFLSIFNYPEALLCVSILLMKTNDFQLNKIEKDEFGRISGILALNKPAGITSHDLVDDVRKKFKIRKVGHAGALDPFATGVMIILIGKATKLSNKLLTLDKEYEFEVLLGVSTDTQDTEGKILKIESPPKIDQVKIDRVIADFKGTYLQTVPIFSSIRSNGIRLRELAHASTKIERSKKGNDYYAKFTIDKNKPIFRKLLKDKITIKLPKRPVKILKTKLLGIKTIQGRELKLVDKRMLPDQKFLILKLLMRVSKGTYIRQLAEDIGERFGGIPAMLYSLERTKVGKISGKDIISLDKL
jgi:tRNA U55 pseudouridine synthase TruB